MEPFVRITLDKTTLAPETRILKARDCQVFEQSRQVLADAQRESQAILRRAEQEYEKQRTLGYQVGMDQAKMETAEKMIDTVSRTIDYFAQVENHVAGIVISAVRKILGEFDDLELTLRVVRNALNVVRTQHQVTLRTSPAQEDDIRERVDEILKSYSGIRYLQVIADHRLQAGDCILETELGAVDANLELQLKALENALYARFQQHDAG